MTDKISKAIENTVGFLRTNSEKNYSGLKNTVRRICELMQIAMFPSFAKQNLNICSACADSSKCNKENEKELTINALSESANLLINALSKVTDYNKALDLTECLIKQIPSIKTTLDSDAEAAFEGDPAANSKDEIILAYPGFTAVCIYRIAHELYKMGVEIIPRMMTEYAHEITGIDIHPGATIGNRFFIDHGTGVVIGETTTIGNHVKLYQHVTLGAKSFDVKPDGSLVKGIKRHPDIGNNVVIYAGATILGGDTVIGNNCVIGGNVWLTHSVEDGKTITSKN